MPSTLPHFGKDRGPSAADVRAKLQSLTGPSDFFSHQRLIATPRDCEIDCCIFEGFQGGGELIKIGVFAGIHGDEKAGPFAIIRLAERLIAEPRLAEGYEIRLYPVCNPGGFDAGTRTSLSGKDLNREFWKNSQEPEVKLLEVEIQRHSFHGLISLHSDDTSDGLYGFVRGAVLARSLLEPALTAAEKFLPRNKSAIIDGFPAHDGIISECYDGILTSPPKLENTPFEVIFETPHAAEPEKQIDATVAAILSILTEYRKFIAFAADL